MYKILLAAFAIAAIFSLPSCLKDKLEKTYTVFEPVYKEKSAVLADIGSSAPQPIHNPGKMYQSGNYIFLNEINKGVHVIDNSDPVRPVVKAFIRIPGNIDIAVKGNILYADLYRDMVAIDMTDPMHAQFLKLTPAVFPERYYGPDFQADNSKVVVDWKQHVITEKFVDVDTKDILCARCVVFVGLNNSAPSSVTTGVGGSMARFAVVNNYLYAVNSSSLGVINISNAADPILSRSVAIGWNIETIYPFGQRLFIGSSTGMFAFDITNPSSPVLQGNFTHVRACDPVVANNRHAFVTLRAGTFCDGTTNELEILDIQNINQPQLIKAYPLTGPYGLALDGNKLFVCDGKAGLKLYDVSNVYQATLLRSIDGMEAYDVIASGNNRLTLVSKDGLYQYDYSDVNHIRELSKIQISR